MGLLLSNSYRMWVLRLAVVAALAGGLSWWALSGDDYLEATGDAAQSCHQAEPLQDVDILLHSEVYVDGKLEITRTLNYHLSGENVLMLWDERPKEAKLYYEGTVYHRDEEGNWTKGHDYGAYKNRFVFPLSVDSICPNLAAFAYASTDKVEDQSAKKFTVPTLSGEPFDNSWPTTSEPPLIYDWAIWINDAGYIVKATYKGRYGWKEGMEKWESHVTAVYTEHGVRNVMPNRSK